MLANDCLDGLFDTGRDDGDGEFCEKFMVEFGEEEFGKITNDFDGVE